MTAKTETAADQILQAALEAFREEGFDSATMRNIAQRAGVATGAAYYYYVSKEAIVMEWYRRASNEMQPQIPPALENVTKLDDALSALIRVKLDHFGPQRGVLRALLRNGADPQYPLSPFSAETRPIRDLDIAWFERIVKQSGVRLPRDLAPRLPRVLWFFQMGIILFWVTDDSPRQTRTAQLLPLACKLVSSLIRLSSLPLLRPMRKPVLNIIDLVAGD